MGSSALNKIQEMFFDTCSWKKQLSPMRIISQKVRSGLRKISGATSSFHPPLFFKKNYYNFLKKWLTTKKLKPKHFIVYIIQSYASCYCCFGHFVSSIATHLKKINSPFINTATFSIGMLKMWPRGFNLVSMCSLSINKPNRVVYHPVARSKFSNGPGVS